MSFVLLITSALLAALAWIQMRLYACLFGPGLDFVALAALLLGISAAGILLALRRRVTSEGGLKVLPPPGRAVRWGLFLLAAGIIVSDAFAARHSGSLIFKLSAGEGQWKSALVLILAALPALGGGLVIIAILSDSTRRISRLCALILLGFALGLGAVPFALTPLGLPALLAVTTTIAALLLVPACATPGGRLVSFTITALLGAGSFLFLGDLYPFELAPPTRASLGSLVDHSTPATTSWDPQGCVRVYEASTALDPRDLPAASLVVPAQALFIDTLFSTPKISSDAGPRERAALFERTLFAAPYFGKRPGLEVLVIDPGGGIALETARFHGAKRISTVDANRSILALARATMGDRDDTSASCEMRTCAENPRSFLRGEKDSYDVIQLALLDEGDARTEALRSVQAEDRLTVEAFEAYFAHLTDNGVLAILCSSRNTLERLTATALATLERRPEHPAAKNHVILLRQSAQVNGVARELDCLLVRGRGIFTPWECKALEQWVASSRQGPAVHMAALELAGIPLHGALEILYRPGAKAIPEGLMRAVLQGRRDAYLDACLSYAHDPSDISPTWDDRPFFHTFHDRKTIIDSARYYVSAKLEAKAAKLGLHLELTAANPVPPGFLGQDHPVMRRALLCILLGLLLALAALLPPIWFRILGDRIAGSITWALFFATASAAAILAVSCALQIHSPFLPDPTQSFAIIAGGTLLWAVPGALLGGPLARSAPLRASGLAIFAILLGLLFQQVALPGLLERSLGLDLWLRMAISFASLLPLGLPLGILLAIALYIVRMRGENFVPWSQAILWIALAMALTAAPPLALLYGFTNLALGAGGLLLCALLMVHLAPR